MPRRYRPTRRSVEPDIRYDSEIVSFFINKVMRAGKKEHGASPGVWRL
jgi:ribosomal protein S7